MNARARKHGQAQRGLSLVELMVALAIGMLLMLGLVQVMSASRAAYRLAEGIGRAQENARFAMDSLERDLRMAGHLGCISDSALLLSPGPAEAGLNLLFLSQANRVAGNFEAAPYPLRFDVGLQGFEALGTTPGNTVTLAQGEPALGNANQWSPSLPAELAALQPVQNSDIVVMRYFAPDSTGITAFDTGSGAGSVAPARKQAVTDATASGLFGLSDCLRASVFAGTVDAGSGTVTVASGGGQLNRSGFMGDRDLYDLHRTMLYRAEVVVYYVGRGEGSGASGVRAPSLFRARFVRGSTGALDTVREELVEGIESLQLLYGQDRVTAAGQPPSGYIATSWTGNEIGGGVVNPSAANAALWRRVGLAQIGLVMRSSEGAVSAQRDPAIQQLSVLGTRVNPQNDGYYRSVYETSVAQRNRLFEN